MAITRADVTTAARDRLNRDSTAVLTVEKAYRAFESAQKRLARDLRCLHATQTVDVTAADYEYDWPAGAIDLVAVRYYTSATNWRELAPIGYRRLPDNWDTTWTGTPAFWSKRGGRAILLHPVPSATVANGLAIEYVHLPTELAADATADATELEFEDDVDDALALAMAVEMARMDLNDPLMASLLPVLESDYHDERDRLRVLFRSANRPLVIAGGGEARQPADTRLPGNYVVVR